MNALELIRKCTFEQAKKFTANIPEGFTHYSFEHQAFINLDYFSVSFLNAKPIQTPHLVNLTEFKRLIQSLEIIMNHKGISTARMFAQQGRKLACSIEYAIKFSNPLELNALQRLEMAVSDYDLIFGVHEPKHNPITERKYTVQVHNWGY
ncbi:hypothetical protein APC42_17390 [Acinetobacter pittii]|uniref:hypothetical protein n=1 Tax=Acinetobacter pittii TaxID=48296 RepID=UPI0007104DDE|nr:hypothetical protein [Acinetobacter pittii]KRI46499.1 hypothetical protein APC42_17390 [Acinetobacter pittii]